MASEGGALHPRLALVFTQGIDHEVQAERERAHLKHGAKGNSREDAPYGDAEWLPILMEELGEVAHEMTYDTDAVEPEEHRAALRSELIQVAAMAHAWIAAIDSHQFRVANEVVSRSGAWIVDQQHPHPYLPIYPKDNLCRCGLVRESVRHEPS